jgi:plasmid stability protein
MFQIEGIYGIKTDAKWNRPMSINLSIKNASDEVVAALKLRAQRNHRSLQGELMAIIEDAAANWLTVPEERGFLEIAAEWRTKDQAGDTDYGRRERDIQHLMGLLEKGLPFGKRRFTRDEMHER